MELSHSSSLTDWYCVATQTIGKTLPSIIDISRYICKRRRTWKSPCGNSLQGLVWDQELGCPEPSTRGKGSGYCLPRETQQIIWTMGFLETLTGRATTRQSRNTHRKCLMFLDDQSSRGQILKLTKADNVPSRCGIPRSYTQG